MAGDVVNLEACSTLNHCSGLTGNNHAICHYSYNLLLAPSLPINLQGIFKIRVIDTL